jgi:methionyl-tRNA formyltransferase
MNHQQPRLAFMGTPDFAVHILKSLLQTKYQIVAVYTQPPRPVGRGYKVTPSPVHELAIAEGLPVFTPESLKPAEVQNQWSALDLDVAVVAAYGLILPKTILDAPRLGCLNIHASLLPRWRGAAPIQRAILSGDKETGVTIMKMDTGLDTGDTLLMKKIAIDDSMTTPGLFDTITHVGAEALLEALPLYLSGNLSPTPQPHEGVTYANKLGKEEGHLDWRLTASELERKVRALNPWPGTWFEIGSDRIKVLKAEVVAGPFPHPPGTVIDDKLTIVCGEGALRPLWLQKVGKAALPAEAFLRGYELPSRQLLHVAV